MTDERTCNGAAPLSPQPSPKPSTTYALTIWVCLETASILNSMRTSSEYSTGAYVSTVTTKGALRQFYSQHPAKL